MWAFVHGPRCFGRGFCSDVTALLLRLVQEMKMHRYPVGLCELVFLGSDSAWEGNVDLWALPEPGRALGVGL